MNLIDQIYSIFDRFGYFAVLIGVMFDNAGFPVPGELILLITGSLVANQSLGFVPAVLSAAAGALLSDSGWYFAGRLGSRRLIRLYCRVSFGSTACLAKTERNLSRFGAASLIYARFIPGFRTFAAPMAGMAGVPYRLFALYDGLGALLWAALGIAIGSLFEHQLALIASRLEDTRAILIYVAGAGLLLFLLLKWLVRRIHGRAEIEARTVIVAKPPGTAPL